MSCVAVRSGDQFVVSIFSHIDCQARTLGSFGYQSLADPGSPVAQLLTGVLTLFIALFGLRLLLGERVPFRNALQGAIKVGIMLTLVTSWPAVRILLYDAVANGAQTIAAPIAGASGLTGELGVAERLQNADRSIARLTRAGTGRFQAGSVTVSDATTADEAFREIALRDETGWGDARVLFLAVSIAPLALLRIAAGILLALTPLFALLLLFEGTRGVFVNWLSALFATVIGAVAVIILLNVELAVLEPWLADALAQRAAATALPQAPTELLAMMYAFAAIAAGLLLLIVRIGFAAAQPVRNIIQTIEPPALAPILPPWAGTDGQSNTSTERSRTLIGDDRVARLVEAVGSPGRIALRESRSIVTRNATDDATSPALGQAFRRTRHRAVTASARNRDARHD